MNVSVILLRGREWFSSIGAKNCTGTKCFSLTSKVNNPSLSADGNGIVSEDADQVKIFKYLLRIDLYY